MKKLVIVLITGLIAIQINAQNNQEWKYFGQTPPGDSAIVFAPGIVSTKKLEHSSPTFSPDLKTFFWSANAFPLGENNKTIYCCKYENGNWTKATVAPFSGKYNDDSPFYHKNKIYFSSDRNQEPLSDSLKSLHWTLKPNSRIWCSELIGGEWIKPSLYKHSLAMFAENIRNKFNKIMTLGFSKSGNMYFLAYLEGVPNKCGIYRSEYKDGIYSQAEPLPACINSTHAQDWTPYISPDESYLIFSSYRNGGYGQGDLYISFHDVETDTWSEAINMGDKINTGMQERFPVVTPDGKYLFFTRPRPGFSQDVYWVRTNIIDDLKKKTEKSH